MRKLEALNVNSVPLRVLCAHMNLPEAAPILQIFSEAARRTGVPRRDAVRAFRKGYAQNRELPDFVRMFYEKILHDEQQRIRQMDGRHF